MSRLEGSMYCDQTIKLWTSGRISKPFHHRLAQFGGMKDELILDQLVIGIQDSTFSEWLPLICQRESVKTQQAFLLQPQIKQRK